ncbi:MAG: hypothetical protein ABSE40_23035 [Candidatus Sulfotelmatobacter sp.]|jgi:hypothetical protein
MGTTYIFGAGASLHAGYPLVSTMGALWLDFMLRIPIPQFQSDAQFLIDTFGKAPNAEDVITAIQSRIKELEKIGTPDSEAERTMLGNCRGRLTSALREWFRDIHTKAAPVYAGHGLVFAANAGLTKGLALFAGPVGWALDALWGGMIAAGPAYRVTIPCVVQVALIRQSMLCRKRERKLRILRTVGMVALIALACILAVLAVRDLMR